MTTAEKTKQLDIDRMDAIILDLSAARIAIMKDKRKEAREVIDTCVKDLQTQSWMLNTVP